MLAWPGTDEEPWPQRLRFPSGNRNRSSSPSLLRSEWFLQDSVPGGAGAVSCPILTRHQQAGCLSDGAGGAGGAAPAGGRLAQLGPAALLGGAMLHGTDVDYGHFPRARSTVLPVRQYLSHDFTTTEGQKRVSRPLPAQPPPHSPPNPLSHAAGLSSAAQDAAGGPGGLSHFPCPGPF